MPIQKFSTKGSLLLVVALVALLAGVATAVNASSSGAGLIHSCVNSSSGEIKIVDPDEKCKKNWETTEWNALGPRGPQGPTGATGATGAADGGAWRRGEPRRADRRRRPGPGAFPA